MMLYDSIYPPSYSRYQLQLHADFCQQAYQPTTPESAPICALIPAYLRETHNS